MLQESDKAPSQTNSDRYFQRPLQAWEVLFLLGLATALLVAAAWESNKEYLGNDELCTAILISNPSFVKMMNTLRHGGELNPPLYFAIEWLFARFWGTGELALRALSTISVVLGTWLLFFTMRPLTGPRLAALALALVGGLSRGVFFYSMQARYYGLLFLLVAAGLFLAMRVQTDKPLRWPDYLLVLLTHSCLVYVHLYGLLYSGLLLTAMLAVDCLRGKLRWGLYASVAGAWAAFGAWLPFSPEQLKSVAAGAWIPPHYHTIGFIIEEMALQTPLGLTLLLTVLLGGLALIVVRPCAATKELEACSAPQGWATLAVLSLALMTLPIGAWLGSFRITALFMPRYVFPCTGALVIISALILLAVHRLPRMDLPFPLGVPPALWDSVWFVVLAFCLLFQPLRAWKNPARPVAPFLDNDYGYKNLPIVFEDMWYYLPRAVYGQGRQYLMVIDRSAAEADRGWYTKCMDRFFQPYYPSYEKVHVAHSEDLPEEFIAVDDDYAKTFEWIFQHRPDLQARLLGTRELDIKEHGQERVFLVRRVSASRAEGAAR